MPFPLAVLLDEKGEAAHRPTIIREGSIWKVEDVY
jgi:hypothetical protein